MKVYTLEIRRWESDHECDCNVECPLPNNHWELIGVYNQEDMISNLTKGFPHPDNKELIVDHIGYSDDELGCFWSRYNYGYFRVLVFLV